MKATLGYREILIEKCCKRCTYREFCGIPEEMDCEALKWLVKIYEDVDRNDSLD